jgi:hypothetical protein
MDWIVRKGLLAIANHIERGELREALSEDEDL